VDHVGTPQQALTAPLAPQKNVLRHGQLGSQRQILVDDLDPTLAGVLGRVEDDRLPVHDQVAGPRLQCAAQDLQQGRLPGAVVTHGTDHLARVDLDVHVV
jgi:hypothetical protein